MKSDTSNARRETLSTGKRLRPLTARELTFFDWNCADCGVEHRRARTSGIPHSYCRKCSNRRQRESRARIGPPTGEQRRKANARSYTNVYIKRGLLVKQPCEGIRNGRRCMRRKVQAHHDDYSKPLDVRWLCDECHRAHHRDHG